MRAPAEKVRLSGPSIALDARVNAFRPDLVDIRLASRIISAHYAVSLDRACVGFAVPMRSAPTLDSPAVSELLLGEKFALLDTVGDWAWGYSCHDDYVGYVPRTALGRVGRAPTQIVATAAALIFTAPDIKSPVCARWPLGCRFAGDDEGDFLATAQGFVHRRHVVALGARVDAVALAERLVGVPYRWGGRSGDGIDCSGLVQTALAFAGVTAPRDSDQQRVLGEALAPDEPLQRGDLIFFPGHVGLMIDGERLIHANAHWMQVVVEPLADVTKRLRPKYDEPIIARRRLA